MLQWPTQTNQEEVEAFCYLPQFLRRFIPGRAELVCVIKYGARMEITTGQKENKGAVERLHERKVTEFTCSREIEVAFQVIE